MDHVARVCVCCRHIKNLSDISTVPSSVRTDPTHDAVDSLGHRLMYLKRYPETKWTLRVGSNFYKPAQGMTPSTPPSLENGYLCACTIGS